VVNPPLDVLTWMEVGHQTRTVVEGLDLFRADPVVLVPAKALPHKGLDRAVRVGITLADRCPAARVLVTAAPSPHEPRISAAMVRELRTSIQGASANAAVILLSDLVGEIPTDRTVRDLMQLCDVVFVPSLEEGFGMPLREAAALGVPVVCTDIPVFREVAEGCATFFDQNLSDRYVTSLVLAAAQARRNPARRGALDSMIQFTADLERLLSLTDHPKL
jgi:mannosylglucosylglycerate synthase